MWLLFVALLCALTPALAQDYSTVAELVRGPENSPVICLLLHGAAYSSKTWDLPNLGTVDALSAAGVRVVAIDLPGTNAGPALSPTTPISGLIPFIFDKHLSSSATQATMIVSPSLSGAFSLPYISSLTAAGQLAAYVPVAPVGVQSWEGPGNEAVTQSLEVHAIYGGSDSIYLPDLARFESIFPNLNSTVVPGGNHAVYFDAPDLFNAVLLDLAAKIAPTPLTPEVSATESSPGSESTAGVSSGLMPRPLVYAAAGAAVFAVVFFF